MPVKYPFCFCQHRQLWQEDSTFITEELQYTLKIGYYLHKSSASDLSVDIHTPAYDELNLMLKNVIGGKQDWRLVDKLYDGCAGAYCDEQYYYGRSTVDEVVHVIDMAHIGVCYSDDNLG